MTATDWLPHGQALQTFHNIDGVNKHHYQLCISSFWCCLGAGWLCCCASLMPTPQQRASSQCKTCQIHHGPARHSSDSNTLGSAIVATQCPSEHHLLPYKLHFLQVLAGRLMTKNDMIWQLRWPRLLWPWSCANKHHLLPTQQHLVQAPGALLGPALPAKLVLDAHDLQSLAGICKQQTALDSWSPVALCLCCHRACRW